jgi:hypothetical protein
LGISVQKTEGSSTHPEVFFRLEDATNRTDRRRIHLGAVVEEKEQIAGRSGDAVVDGGGEPMPLRKVNDDVPRVLSEHRMGGVVSAAVVDDDHLVGLGVAQPQGGQTPQCALAGPVRGDHHGDEGFRFHSVRSWYQGIPAVHRS